MFFEYFYFHIFNDQKSYFVHKDLKKGFVREREREKKREREILLNIYNFVEICRVSSNTTFVRDP